MFSGTVKTGIGRAVAEMSRPGGIKDWESLTGLRVIPGTLNLKLTDPFDLSLLKYLSFSKMGWSFDPATQGFDYKGDIGMHYSSVTIADKYQGILVFFTWVPGLNRHAELISDVHLRTKLVLENGDDVSFTLFEECRY